MSTYAVIALELAIADVPNSNAREHWSKTARKRAGMRKWAGELARIEYGRVGAVETPVNLTLRFSWPDRRRRDLDNFESKGLIDGLVDGGLLPDDDGTHVASVLRTLDASHKPDKGRVRIAVELRTVGAPDVPEAEV